jgi:hypothetical protein
MDQNKNKNKDGGPGTRWVLEVDGALVSRIVSNGHITGHKSPRRYAGSRADSPLSHPQAQGSVSTRKLQRSCRGLSHTISL